MTAVTQVSSSCPDPKLTERGGKRAFAVMITEYWFSLILIHSRESPLSGI
jgi:hypothetical protein